MEYQKTIRRAVRCSGIGLHSGKPVNLRMLPAEEDTGVVFRRVDLNNAEIPAKQEFITQVNYATSISNGHMHVYTVEHLLAALYGLGVNNIVIEMDCDEVPIMDGSAAPFVDLLNEAGIVRFEKSQLLHADHRTDRGQRRGSFDRRLSVRSFRYHLYDQL